MVIHQEPEFNALLEKKLGVNDQEKVNKNAYNQYYLVVFLSVASLAAFSTERITATGDPDRRAQSKHNHGYSIR